jgi:hypothetical protein
MFQIDGLDIFLQRSRMTNEIHLLEASVKGREFRYHL